MLRLSLIAILALSFNALADGGMKVQVVNPTEGQTPFAGAPKAAAALPPINTPNISGAPTGTTKERKGRAAEIVSNFLQALSGGGGAPPQFLPNGEPNPAYQQYMNSLQSSPYFGGSGATGNGYGGGGDGFVPTSDPVVVNPEYKALCQGLSSTNPSSFAGHHCGMGDRDRMTCMVCNLYYEANDQPYSGIVTVGRSVLTRVFSSQYAGHRDGTCQVVYRNNGRVAQYSWIFERKNHTLPAGPALDKVVKAAAESFCSGPNQYTNYFAQALVRPGWYSGQCYASRMQIAGHTFCRIGGNTTRSVAEVLSAEGVTVRASAESSSESTR